MSQFPIDEQLVKRADYAYNPMPADVELSEVEEYLPAATGPYQTLGERAKLLKDQMAYAAESFDEGCRRIALLEAELATLHASNAGQGAEIGKLREHVLELRMALSLLLACHLELVNSGVCGGWDPEGDIEVQSARHALAATEQTLWERINEVSENMRDIPDWKRGSSSNERLSTEPKQ